MTGSETYELSCDNTLQKYKELYTTKLLLLRMFTIKWLKSMQMSEGINTFIT